MHFLNPERYTYTYWHLYQYQIKIALRAWLVYVWISVREIWFHVTTKMCCLQLLLLRYICVENNLSIIKRIILQEPESLFV